ncbi:hypothetical protein SERLADRAFT_472838 [Serpula lacrymans var. lacrymans S7.9]|uniref:Uncharacterized protein n=1 Tax=Serpula lacrymans var. lacrymans (strain S7.9) TaxID=578457 RepID=F8P423_SERL9|nr:uncharacterized protein SERLADRAFT_472838 [Serpula lacrymans var. lacrymans S7.9]EGO22271.1 hypothetical protein SERLADRAFT_472838 [Serpula lacrymans var. lacrymans S7.9]
MCSLAERDTITPATGSSDVSFIVQPTPQNNSTTARVTPITTLIGRPDPSPEFTTPLHGEIIPQLSTNQVRSLSTLRSVPCRSSDLLQVITICKLACLDLRECGAQVSYCDPGL